MNQQTQEKIGKFLELYIDCVNKAAEDFINRKPVDTSVLRDLGNAVAIMHQYKMIGAVPEVPVQAQPNEGSTNKTDQVTNIVLKILKDKNVSVTEFQTVMKNLIYELSRQ